MQKVVIGMSGGVDSSVAAYLLKKQGYDVIGVTMQIWQENHTEEKNGECYGLSAINDAKHVAQQLKIPHYVINFRDSFYKNVIQYFIDDYLKGRTPNPCIACNRYVKWESLLNHSLDMGAGFIATGHYSKVIKLDNGRYTLKKAETSKKDQTYALYNLTQNQLAHTIMPIGEYTKDQIRNLADEIGLHIANKPDSQEICFISDNDYAGYIQHETGYKPQPGNFVDCDGHILGTHKGIIHYTIGQRKGLGIALGKPAFVIEIRAETNEVVIGSNEDVFFDTLYAEHLNFMAIEDFTGKMEVLAKIRYNDQGALCIIEKEDSDLIKCVFHKPVRAITPGQAVVFYQNDMVIGGGTIIGKHSKR